MDLNACLVSFLAVRVKKNDERNAGDIRHSRILGIDICGEIQTDIPVPEYLEAEEKNEKVNIELFRFISEHVKKFR